MGEARSKQPLERDSKGTRILTHDRGGYARGCGCDACTADHAAYKNERSTAARQAAGARERLTVEIHFRVTAETAAELDALTGGRGTRNTTARDILLGALEDGQQDGEQQGSEKR